MAFENLYNKEVESLRESEFPQLKGLTYVEHVGATLYAKSQIDAYNKDLLSNLYGNPHSRSESSRLSTDVVDQVRSRILQHFNTSHDKYTVIFTANCTGALKTIAETFNFSCDNERETTESRHDSTNQTQSRSGCFCYLLDNHTSVQGMRASLMDRAGAILCLDTPDLQKNKINISNILLQQNQHDANGNSLFVYPAQSNFSGHKYPLSWINQVQQQKMGFQQQFPGHWYILLDAAAFVSTSDLDLTKYDPDFVALSFYKMFGFPTGLGAFLVKNTSSHVLQKKYFGGGTVSASSATEMYHVFRPNLAERFEDGTIPFLDIIAVRHGLDTLQKIGGGMRKISSHTFCIGRYFYQNLVTLQHSNGNPLAEIYCDGDFEDMNLQGAVVNFNLQRSDGTYIGFAEVDKMAQLYDIHLRTGCFCNIGACQKYLNISSCDIKRNLQAGHVCGDDRDLIDGHPTGSVRISFGYMSTLQDAQHCLKFIVECFLENTKFKPTFTEASDQIESEQKQKDITMATSIPSSVRNVNKSRPNNSNAEDAITQKVIESCSEQVRRLTAICVYPVKSCAAFMVSEWEIGPKGLLFDRGWMIVSESGVAVSQKREPKLCLIKPYIDLTNDHLILEHTGMEPLVVPIQYSAKECLTNSTLTCTSKVCGDRVLGIDCGDTASDWLSEALQRPGCRLIQQNITDTRTSKLKDKESEENQAENLSLSNESQYLLITRPSVKELQNKICQGEEEMIEMDSLLHRFRGNLIIGGGSPFEEDEWTSVSIGENLFTSQGGCSRCQMICLDQKTGNRSKEPLRTLASWRGRKVPFGIHLRNNSSKEGAMLCVGDFVKLS